MVVEASTTSSIMAERVLAAQHAAREQQRALDVIAHVADHGPHVEAWACLYLQQTVAYSRLWRRYLRSRFGADVAGVRLFDPKRRPRTEDDWRRFLRGYRAWRLYTALACAMTEAGKRGMARGEDPWCPALRAYVDVLKLAPWLHAIEMVLAPSPILREEATIEFSGWAATQINPQYPRVRLWKALGGGTEWGVYLALRDRLPGAVIEAFGDLDPNSDPLAIKAHASTILAGGGVRRRRRRPLTALGSPTRVVDGLVAIDPQHMLARMMAKSEADRAWITEMDRQVRKQAGKGLAELLSEAVAGTPPDDPSLRDVELREAAHAASSVDDVELREEARRLVTEYGLTEREAEVAYLRSEGWKNKRIAERLGGISASTVRVHCFNIRLKMTPAI